ncbi:response regulator transcription factor [Peptostreptococcaceae bacterium AGR-M142]
MQKNILIVDDDKNIANLIEIYLKEEGYATSKAYDGDEALSLFFKNPPNLIILDIMLPKITGFDLCKEIRKTSNIPIIFLTAKSQTIDKVLGLELGGDDYLVKPFEGKELVARVKAVLRRYYNKEDNEEQKIILPNLVMDLNNREVYYNGNLLQMPHKEFELLRLLMSNLNRVFSREELLDKIWGYDYIGESRTVDVHIKRIREKLDGENSWKIKTVWKIGYKLEI